jgi:hypothetical protein
MIVPAFKQTDVTQTTEQPEQTSRVTRGRRPYRSPTLQTYGGIRELTAGGSISTPEGMGAGNRNKRP